MPRSKKKGAAAKSGPQSAEWVQSVAAGLDAEYHGLQAGQMPSEHQLASAVQAVDRVSAAELGGSPGSASGATEVPVSQARLGAVNLHRHSGEGLTATGFEPERHSVMVLGRPVQASPPSAASEGCDGCLASVFLVIHPMTAGLSVLAPILSFAMLCACLPLRSTM